MRLAPLAVVVALAVGASAQTSLRLSDPVLSVDGSRVAVAGAPVTQTPFGVLRLDVPGVGTYRVSERPFAGARRAGEFDGRGLYFAAEGRSVRLVSREPILSLTGPTSAYVAFAPSRSGRRGMARLSVADDLAGRGTRSSDRAPRPVYAAGPRAERPVQRSLGRDAQTRSVAISTEITRLRSQLSRLVADRARLASDRDRLVRERDAALRQARSVQTDRPNLAVQQARRIEALEAERLRLVTERSQIGAARDQARAERDRLAAEFAALRDRAERAEARVAGWSAQRADTRRDAAELASLRAQRDELSAETARLRAAIQDRDRALGMLSEEQTDRQARLPGVASELATARRDLAAAIAARDRAFADRDAAYAARDAAVARADALATRGAPSPDLSAAQAALDRDRRLLDADRAALAAERDAFEAQRDDLLSRASGAPAPPPVAASSDLADRQALLDQLAAAQREREVLLAEQAALMAERDRLRQERSRLTGEVDALQSRPAPPPPIPRTVRTPTEASDGAIGYLPGFDFGRLQNPDVIRRRLDEAAYPRWATVGRIEGDVLVLFQTDPTGRVVRTAVPTPIGGGLDALAEEVVREMRFVPPVVEGQPTGLRSQVVVRFEL